MVEESRDPTAQRVWVVCDAELHEQREAVVVGAFADEVGAVELEDRYQRQVDTATGRGKPRKGPR